MARRGQGKGRRRSSSQWRSLLAKFASSGMGVEAFCRREAISAASFYRWRGLLKNDGASDHVVGNERAPAFVDLGPLDTVSSSRPGIDLTLDLGDGLTLRLVRR